MRTVVIWDSCGMEALCWFVVEGDKSHLHGHYVNSTETPYEIGEEVNSLGYNEEGQFMQEKNTDFNAMPRDADVKIIVCGFLP